MFNSKSRLNTGYPLPSIRRCTASMCDSGTAGLITAGAAMMTDDGEGGRGAFVEPGIVVARLSAELILSHQPMVPFLQLVPDPRAPRARSISDATLRRLNRIGLPNLDQVIDHAQRSAERRQPANEGRNDR